MSVFKNPFFILPCILFWINQYFEKVLGTFIPYVHSYLDDFLAMPVVLGLTLQIYQWIHPLRKDFVFSKVQVVVAVIYFAVIFEAFLPFWSDTYTMDVLDVFCYGLGTIWFYFLINKRV
jgi:hypothetical protein